jgi:DNA-binding transcriptional LysR family regulator
MDRLQAIELFIRVVDLGSFSKAAADLGMGQPTATKLVASLEKQLGSRLLHRSTRGVSPTEIGTLYYNKCKLIAHHLEEAQSVSTLLQSKVQGALRISTSVAFGRRVLSPMVMRFMQMHPKLHIELNFDDRYVNLVEQGIDVAVRMGPLADSSLGARYLGTNPWVMVASRSYLDLHGVPSNPTDLALHDALIYSTVQGDARWHLSGANGQSKVVQVRGPLRSNNLSALLLAARNGLGLVTLPKYVAQESLRGRFLEEILTDWTLPAQEIHAVYPSPQLVPTKVTSFVTWLQGQFVPGWWSEDVDQKLTP